MNPLAAILTGTGTVVGLSTAGPLGAVVGGGAGYIASYGIAALANWYSPDVVAPKTEDQILDDVLAAAHAQALQDADKE